MRAFNVNSRGTFVSLLILACIIGLFFLPEFLSNKNPKNPTKGDKASNKSSIAKSAKDDSFEATLQDPLPLYEIDDSSDLTGIEKTLNSPLDEVSLLIDEQNAAAGIGSANSDDRTRFRSSIGTAQLTWASIKSKEAQQAINSARDESVKLVKLIPENKVASRQALFSYVTGLNFILKGAEQTMAPEEALDYIGSLDTNVTRAMVDENVARAQYMSWTQISLTPELNSARAMRLKRDSEAPFNPRLSLGKMRVFVGNYDKGRATYPNRVELKFYLFGDEIQKVNVYRNGYYLRELGVSEADRNKRRTFEFTNDPGAGFWTFKVVDKYGKSYQKSYAFFPRVQKFKRGQDGYYLLPWGDEGPNTQLDRYFLVSVSRQSRNFGPSAGFVEF